MDSKDPTLFDQETVRRLHHKGDPETSRLTAEKAAAALPKRLAEVAGFFKESGPNGASQHDCGRYFQARSPNPARYAHSTHRSRVPELEERGILYRVGTKTDPITKNAVNVYVHRDYLGDKTPTGRPPKFSMEGLKNRIKNLEAGQFDLWNACVMAAPHHQGGHSAVGEAIAKALGIPFPITMANIPPRKARSEVK